MPGDTASRWGSSACLPCGCKKKTKKEKTTWTRKAGDCWAPSFCQDLSVGLVVRVKSLDRAVKGSGTWVFFILYIRFVFCFWAIKIRLADTVISPFYCLGGQFGRAVIHRLTIPNKLSLLQVFTIRHHFICNKVTSLSMERVKLNSNIFILANNRCCLY